MLKTKLSIVTFIKKLYFNLDKNPKLSFYIYICLFDTISTDFEKNEVFKIIYNSYKNSFKKNFTYRYYSSIKYKKI